MAFVFYYQKHGGEEVWQEALASERQRIVATERPRFTTILDVSEFVTSEMTPEQISGLRYKGPFFVDFDASDIGIAIEAFKRFLAKLKDLGVGLHAAQLFATGGRGFHALLPMEMFLAKPPTKGVVHLPAIYREIAYELFVDTMDMRIYSARRGRQFREPNVVRENGRYKVPLTADEAFAMTAESYATLTSSPRESPSLAPPQLNSKLAVIWAKAEQKVAAAAKKRKESSKDAELLKKYGGAFPPTIVRLMNGDGIAKDTGFHSIALQIGIAANALGKKEDEVLVLCEGLFANHESDGTRYNTPDKRRAEVQRMLRYTDGNVCYTYSKGAIKSLLAPGQATADLDGLSAAAGAVTSEASEIPDDGMLGGVFLAETGVYKRTDEGVTKISNVSFKDVSMLADALTGKVKGYLPTVLLDGKPHGQELIPLDVFMGKQRYQAFTLSHGGIMQGGDNQVASVAACLREMAMKTGNVNYVLHQEGLDIINRPETSDGTMDVVWVTPTGVETFGTSPIRYTYKPDYMKAGAFRSDLMDAPGLAENNEEQAKVFESLFQMNQAYVVGSLMGWFVSTFHKALYRKYWNQFPLCHVFGQAGCGKTETIMSLQRLFYMHRRPELLQADSSTPFGIEATIQSSCSLPVVLDEYKPREMRPGKHQRFQTLFRAIYNEGAVRKGGGDGELGSTWRDVQEKNFTAPTMFVGEALETQSAILERSVVVPMSKAGLNGREAAHLHVRDNGHVLTCLGKEIVKSVFILDFEQFKEQFEDDLQEVKVLAFRRNNHRVVYNMTVPISGLRYMQAILRSFFGDRFDGEIARLRATLLDINNQVAVTVMPEAAKVISALAFISQTEDVGSELGLREGVDYQYISALELDIKVRHCYIKYSAWARRKGQVPLYDNEDAFTSGLGNYSAVTNRVCADSPLKDTANTRVLRFSTKNLEEEGVEPFKGAPGT